MLRLIIIIIDSTKKKKYFYAVERVVSLQFCVSLISETMHKRKVKPEL